LERKIKNNFIIKFTIKNKQLNNNQTNLFFKKKIEELI